MYRSLESGNALQRVAAAVQTHARWVSSTVDVDTAEAKPHTDKLSGCCRFWVRISSLSIQYT